MTPAGDDGRGGRPWVVALGLVVALSLFLHSPALSYGFQADDYGHQLVLEGAIVGEGANRMAAPRYNPGRHAEIEALGAVPEPLWPRASQMTCYSTLEPCVMCTGTLLLHGIGRVVFGAVDVGGGGGGLLDHLPAFFEGGGVPQWVGPVLPERCDPLYARAREMFVELPCGKRSKR